jgi:cytochrome c
MSKEGGTVAMKMMRTNTALIATVVVTAAAVFGAASSAQAQTAQEGRTAFAVCAGCHSVDGSTKAGPTMKGIVGRKAAADAGFNSYSTALRNSKIVWNAAELDAYLKAPTTRVKGTTMMVGVPDAKRRKAIIAYMRTLK